MKIITNWFFVLLIIYLLNISAGSAGAQGNAQYVREPLHEFVQDQTKLVSLIRGIREMKRRNSAPKDSVEYRTSWEYWSSIHGYPGTGSPNGTVEDWRQFLESQAPVEAPLFSGFFNGLQNRTAPDALAEEVWATCEHGTEHFFAWHRMYLYFFERVLRAASGNPDFALPYWDYTNIKTDPADPASAPWKVPGIFAVPTLDTAAGEIANPLFEPRRTAGFGSSVQIDEIATDVDSVLALTDFLDFQQSLDRGVHGFIHCAVGNGCLAPFIGLVPFAGQDPLFWLHHANIDRLWECWTQKHGREQNPLTNTDWMNREYVFVDENGDRVTMKVAELFDPNGRIDYAYDNASQCFRVEPPAGEAVIAAFRERANPGTVAATASTLSRSEVALASSVSVKELEQNIGLISSSAMLNQSERAVLMAVRPNVLQPTRAILRLEDVEIGKALGLSVRVFVTNRRTSARAFAGVMSFFAVVGPDLNGDGGRGGHSHGKSAHAFDVTEQLKRLFQDNPNPQLIGISLVSNQGVTTELSAGTALRRLRDADLRIGKVSVDIESASQNLDLR